MFWGRIVRTKPAQRAAPPNPGTVPGGVRDRALQAVLKRGPQPDDKKKTRRSQEHWAKYRRELERAAVPPEVVEQWLDAVSVIIRVET
jgi:hypothetical protein